MVGEVVIYTILVQLTVDGETPGLIIQDGRVTVTAPSLRYMAGWTLARVEQYAAGCGWTVTEL